MWCDTHNTGTHTYIGGKRRQVDDSREKQRQAKKKWKRDRKLLDNVYFYNK